MWPDRDVFEPSETDSTVGRGRSTELLCVDVVHRSRIDGGELPSVGADGDIDAVVGAVFPQRWK